MNTAVGSVLLSLIIIVSYPGGFREILAKRVHDKDKTMVQSKTIVTNNYY